MLNITPTPLPGALVIEPQIFKDNRGFFLQTFQAQHYTGAGLPEFVQDNFSRSRKHVLRGLHYQLPNAQGKLLWVTQGAVWDVIVDVRKSSKTFGQWFSIELNDQNHKQLYIPTGFAHGFCVLSDVADFHYKCTEYYSPNTERGIIWNDPYLDIPWPTDRPLLSSKDQRFPLITEIADDNLFA